MSAPAPLHRPPQVRSPLLQSLAGPLPALATALEGELALERLQGLTVDGVQAVALTAGSVWLRDDGSCSLRYRVEISPDDAPGGPHVVMARVCPSEASARRYVGEVAALAPRRPARPWRDWVARFENEPVALHPFPIDPGVPTLGAVLESEEVRSARAGTPRSLEVVRHPRDGGVVLRSRVADRAEDAKDNQACYAKVYPDGTAGTVYRFLGSLDAPPALRTAPRPVRLPGVLGYRPDLKLLLTEALPGQPALPALAHEVLSAASPGSDAAPVAGLRAAVGEAGRVLGALHSVANATAPQQPPGRVWADLVRELQVVARVWPGTADAVRASVAGARPQVTAPVERVLCHGDYTPSQILFSEGHVSGLVDFDTVCWGDPAMDLGRFLAHLDLLLAKTAGVAPQPLRQHLRTDFFSGYAESAARRDEALVDRVDAFRTVALAISALHACRQLKDRRLDLTLSLLIPRPDQPANNDWPRRDR